MENLTIFLYAAAISASYIFGAFTGIVLGYTFYFIQAFKLQRDRARRDAHAREAQKRYEEQLFRKKEALNALDLPKNARQEQETFQSFEESLGNLFKDEIEDLKKRTESSKVR